MYSAEHDELHRKKADYDDTLLPIIRVRILPGTRVMSDLITERLQLMVNG